MFVLLVCFPFHWDVQIPIRKNEQFYAGIHVKLSDLPYSADCLHFEYSRRESNSYLIFRRDLFYPLNYRSRSGADCPKPSAKLRNKIQIRK